MRFVKVNFPASHSDAVIDILEKSGSTDWSIDSGYGRFEKAAEIVIPSGSGQELLDNLQNLLSSTPDWRIVVLPVEALLPRDKTEEVQAPEKTDPGTKSKYLALREELYQKVHKDCAFNVDFVILTILSAIVAAIGLNFDNVAIVIAAMVIAPLLGPILAFALGAALGDIKLMQRATKTATLGLSIGFIIAMGIGFFMPVNLESAELVSRTVLGPEIVILALASGAAAALSLSTGLSSALVGVMVAVALLPPSVAAALFLGSFEFEEAGNATLLLALNVVCAILSAQLVFVWKGVRPRTWFEQKGAKTSVRVNGIIWVGLLAALAVLMYHLNG